MVIIWLRLNSIQKTFWDLYANFSEAEPLPSFQPANQNFGRFRLAVIVVVHDLLLPAMHFSKKGQEIESAGAKPKIFLQRRSSSN